MSVMDNGDRVRHAKNFIPVVRHENNRFSKIPDNIADFLFKLETQMAVKSRKGFIQKEDLRV